MNAGREVRVFVCAAVIKKHREKRFTARIQSERRRHLIITRQRNTLETPEGKLEMTKITSVAAAFVLFAPIAAAILLQAAQIVS
jgi:hypothetical protein